MAASASSRFLLSAKFRPGLPPFQRMTLPYDPHSGNSNPQASLPHFYILQSRGSHSCRVQTPVHLTNGLSFPSPPFDCPVHLTCFRATQDMHKVWKVGGGDTAKWKQKLKWGGSFVTFTQSSWIPLISPALESFVQFCIKMCRQDTQKLPPPPFYCQTCRHLPGTEAVEFLSCQIVRSLASGSVLTTMSAPG